MLRKQDAGDYECFANGETSRVSLTVIGKSEDPVDFAENKIVPKMNNSSLIFRAKSEHACLPNEFACKNGECINQKMMCDGVFDCEDASDEDSCGMLLENKFYLEILFIIF